MKKKAWSLSELLISTTIVAIIFVVLTPILTRRFADEIRTGSSQNDTRLFTPDDPDCTSEVNNSLICEFTVPSGVKSINAILTAGGGGGAGATVSSPQQVNVTNSNTTVKEIPITTSIKNVVITNISGAGGGGGGGAWVKKGGGAPTSQADCPKYSKFLTSTQNHKKAVCVTQYNIGDIPELANGGIEGNVQKVEVIKGNCVSAKCCWIGKTSGTACNSNEWSYSGCNRTLCTWEAANSSCTTLAYSGTKAGDWRLPTKDELGAWKKSIDAINTNKSNGLMLCDSYKNYGAAWCNKYQYCIYNNNEWSCEGYFIWSKSTAGMGKEYLHHELNNGVFNGPEGSMNIQAYSARCVTEKAVESTTVYSGGGGGAGAYFGNYTINEELISNNVGGVIKLTAGSGGNGGGSGSASGSSGTSGNDGGVSKVEIYNRDNVLVWAFEVSGGKGGKAATSSAAGSTSGVSNTCREYNNGAWATTSCSGSGNNGLAGNKATADETITAQGGNGASSSSSSGGAGGAGGSVGNANGSAGSYGAGGGGATITFNSAGTATKGSGGKGGNGKVSIQYDFYPQSAAGGGGGGASIATVSEIEVSGLSTYTVKIGKGGKGGAASQAGGDGGESSIIVNGITYSVYGGKGGGVGQSESTTASLIQGVGGTTGSVSSNIKSSNVKSGKSGKNGTSGTSTDENGNVYTISIGGDGGQSAVGTEGSRGGFSNTSNINAGATPEFKYPAGVFKAINYGSAGAGGGGGGWSLDSTTYPNPGTGGNGQDGYVYIYWTKG